MKYTEGNKYLINILEKDYNLTEREIVAIGLYGILTFKEISQLDIFDCSLERVRQIYAKALRKLRHPARKVLWRDKYQELLNENINLKEENYKLTDMVAKNTPPSAELLTKYNSNINNILSIQINDLELSVRTMNCLHNNNFIFLGDIVAKNYLYFIRLPNFGRKSMSELEELLEEYGLTFEIDVEGWQRPIVEKQGDFRQRRGAKVR